MASDFGIKAVITYNWLVATATIAACLLIAVVASRPRRGFALRTPAIASVGGWEQRQRAVLDGGSGVYREEESGLPFLQKSWGGVATRTPWR